MRPDCGEGKDSMTEADWLTCEGPEPMLEFIRGQASDRKLRLFALACCRRIWDWLGERSRHAIEVMERYLEGRASDEDLRLAMCGARDDWLDEFGTHHPSTAAYCATDMTDSDAYPAATGATAEVAEAVRCEAIVRKTVSLRGWPPAPDPSEDMVAACHEAGEAARRSEQAAQCHLLRDIFHGPRRPVYLRGHWRNEAVLQLAKTIYEERAFDRMAELADALEGVGCDDAEILDHCRPPGEHVRGCWVVDALLLRW
jgi:hypothetical protein